MNRVGLHTAVSITKTQHTQLAEIKSKVMFLSADRFYCLWQHWHLLIRCSIIIILYTETPEIKTEEEMAGICALPQDGVVQSFTPLVQNETSSCSWSCFILI